jgi:two-component system chemotaxis response regulator CheY
MSERSALVVEDSPTMRQLIALALRRIPALGFAEASNGAEALGMLAGRHFDLILLDINMPVMNGFAFLEQLSMTESPPPVIVISTESAREDIERAMSLGAVAYVTKPVRGPDLAATVSRVLAQHAPA